MQVISDKSLLNKLGGFITRAVIAAGNTPIGNSGKPSASGPVASTSAGALPTIPAMDDANKYQLKLFDDTLNHQLDNQAILSDEVNSSNHESVMLEQSLYERMTMKMRNTFSGFMRWKSRMNELARQEEMDEYDDDTKEKMEILQDALKGAVAGFSLGKVMDWVAPQEELDKMGEVRKAYIRMYGNEADYKKVKDALYKNMREMNDKLGVAAFNSDDISEGMMQGIKAGVGPELVKEFSKSAALLRKVGVEFGDETAQNFAMGFKDNASKVMKELADAMAVTRLGDDAKTKIIDATAEMGTFIARFQKTSEGQETSAKLYGLTIGKIIESNILKQDQLQSIQEMMTKAADGDADAMANMAKLGVSGAIDQIKKGNWGDAFQQVLSGISKQSTNAEVLKGMEIDIDPEQIILLKQNQKEISQLSQKVNESYAQTIEANGELSASEKTAAELAKSSITERIKNYLSLTPIVQGVSDWLEKMNIDATTAGTVIGGIGGAAKGTLDTMMLLKMNGVTASDALTKLKTASAAMKTGLMSNLGKVGGFIANMGSQVATFGTAMWTTMLSAGTAVKGFAISAYASVAPLILPILGVVAAVTAVGAAAYMLWKHWDTVKQWFSTSMDWISTKITSIKDTFSNMFSGLPGWAKTAIDAVLIAFNPFIALIKGVKAVWDFFKKGQSGALPKPDGTPQGGKPQVPVDKPVTGGGPTSGGNYPVGGPQISYGYQKYDTSTPKKPDNKPTVIVDNKFDDKKIVKTGDTTNKILIRIADNLNKTPTPVLPTM